MRNAVQYASRDAVRRKRTKRRVGRELEAIERLEKSGIGILVQLHELDIAARLLTMMASRDAARKSGVHGEKPLPRRHGICTLERLPERDFLLRAGSVVFGRRGQRGGEPRHRKLPSTPCSTRLQPSIRTNIKSLIGTEIVDGGTISMPIASRMLDTTRSMRRNGSMMTKPMRNETRNSLSMNAGTSCRSPTSAARAGSGLRAMS